MRIYVRPAGGGRAVALTASLRGYHRAPRWSPDGREVAFQSEGRIYATPVGGGGAARVLVRPDPGARWVAYPAWSPDGRQLAYVQDWAIWVRPAAGGTPRRLAIPQPPREPHSLAWSPDGRWLAFVEGNSEFTYGLRPWGSTVNLGNGAPSEIWLVPPFGGAAVRITAGQSLNTSPTWLPDGSGLLFVSNRDGDRDVYRVLIDASGRPAGGAAPERVTAGLGAHTVSLSRDGRHLVYAVFRSAANVWSIPIPAAGAESAPTPPPEPVTRGSQTIEGLSVSPDGRWLAFDTDRNGNQDIYVAPTRGNGEPAALTSDQADEFMPHWAPDGRELAFYRFGRDGRRAMMTVPVGGGVPRPVVDAPRNQRSPHWSPDGRALVFSSDEATGRDQLYVVERGADGRWGRARLLTTDGGYAGRWSPDGTTISFVRPDGIWTVAPTGGGRRHVFTISPEDEPSLGFVEWEPDGRTLLYKWVDGQGRASFWSLPAAGGRPRRIARLDDPQRPSPRPEFATDGRRIFFTVAERESDVWTMALTSERP
jgi:TolB protein